MLLVSELHDQVVQPPKLKLIVQKRLVDVAALRRKVAELEADKTRCTNQLQRQCDVIKSLERDVTSANARLSDVTGTLLATRQLFFAVMGTFNYSSY